MPHARVEKLRVYTHGIEVLEQAPYDKRTTTARNSISESGQVITNRILVSRRQARRAPHTMWSMHTCDIGKEVA